jgi:hypothetical protein
MQTLCQKHHKPTNVIDLTLKEAICEHCALFEETYHKHEFIEAAELERYAN